MAKLSVLHWFFAREIHQSLGDSRQKGPVTGTFDVFFVVSQSKLLNKHVDTTCVEIGSDFVTLS